LDTKILILMFMYFPLVHDNSSSTSIILLLILLLIIIFISYLFCFFPLLINHIDTKTKAKK